MSNKIKKIKDDMSESIYQIDDGKNQFNLHVSVYQEDKRTKDLGSTKIDCAELRLSSGNKDIYKIKQEGHDSADIRREIAEKLYRDGSAGAIAVKDILLQIKGHQLIEAIKQNMSDIHAREVKQAHERELQELNNSKLAKVRKKAAKLADKVTEKLGLENVVQRFTDGKRIEDIEINSKARVMEKKFSDKWLGRVKE